MMLTPVYTGQFEKDLKLMLRRGKKSDKIKEVISTLCQRQKLDIRHKDHKLIGNYVGRRECHIEPNWLLIYKTEDVSITFERTGTHSDLFE